MEWRTTHVIAPTSDYALSITGLNAKAIEVQDITFTAPDAIQPGASSIAAIVTTSSVSMTRVVLEAVPARTERTSRGPNNYAGLQAPGGSLVTPGMILCTNATSPLVARCQHDGLGRKHSDERDTGSAFPMPPTSPGIDGQVDRSSTPECQEPTGTRFARPHPVSAGMLSGIA